MQRSVPLGNRPGIGDKGFTLHLIHHDNASSKTVISKSLHANPELCLLFRHMIFCHAWDSTSVKSYAPPVECTRGSSNISQAVHHCSKNHLHNVATVAADLIFLIHRVSVAVIFLVEIECYLS